MSLVVPALVAGICSRTLPRAIPATSAAMTSGVSRFNDSGQPGSQHASHIGLVSVIPTQRLLHRPFNVAFA